MPFNLALAATGLVTVLVVEMVAARRFHSGDDAIDPLAIFAFAAMYAVAANLAYTLGWVTELMWTGGDTAGTAARRPRIFYAGLGLSVVVTLAPAILIPALWIILRVH